MVSYVTVLFIGAGYYNEGNAGREHPSGEREGNFVYTKSDAYGFRVVLYK